MLVWMLRKLSFLMRGILHRSSPEIKAGVHIGLFWLFLLQLDGFCAGVGVIKLIVCVH
jgi:hypothetical protein